MLFDEVQLLFFGYCNKQKKPPAWLGRGLVLGLRGLVFWLLPVRLIPIDIQPD